MKLHLKENETYNNPHIKTDLTVTKIYDRQTVGAAPGTIVKRIQYTTSDGVEHEADYEMIRDMVEHAIETKMDEESNLGAVFHSKGFVDTVTLYKMAQNCEIRARIHPKDRDKLADDYQSLTEVEVDWDFVDECDHEATNSNWHPSYQVNFPADDSMYFHPDLNQKTVGKHILISNNELVRHLLQMGFKLGKEHDIKQLAKCCPPLKCMMKG